MDNTTTLRLTKINAVCTRYYASSDVEEIRDSENRLVGLREPDMVILKSTVLKLDNSVFKVSFIIYRGTNIYDLYAMESTDSSIFLAPAIMDSRDDLLWDIYYMNAFLFSEGHKRVPMIRLLFRRGFTDRFKDMDRALKMHEDFVDVDDMDEYTIMYNFRINEKFKKDFDIFLESKYSKLSDSYKARIANFHTLRKTHEIYGILHKTDARRKRVEEKIGQPLPEEAELYHILKTSRETYLDSYRITTRDLGPDLKSFASQTREAGLTGGTIEKGSHSDTVKGEDL